MAVGWTTGLSQAIPIPPRDPAPEWFCELAEAIAGQRIGKETEVLETVPDSQLTAFRERVLNKDPELAADADWFTWARWLFEDPQARTVSPGSKTSTKQLLARLRASDSIAELRQAVRLAPNDGRTFARLALRQQAGVPADLDPVLKPHWEETVARTSDRAVALAPEDPEVWAMRAEVMQMLGRTGRAAEAMEEAMALLPAGATSPIVHYQEALSLVASGKGEAAQASLERVLRGLDEFVEQREAAEHPLPLPGNLEKLRGAASDGVPALPGDLELGDPVPGTYEDFDEVVAGSLPAGWRTWNRSDQGHRRGVRHLHGWQTDLWKDWVVVHRPHFESGDDPVRTRILREGRQPRPVVQGVAGPLLEGGFALAASEKCPGFQIQYLESPDFDCSGRTGVHLAFNSSFENHPNRMAAVEYSL
ncbi:MAG: hypothetical protein GWO24_25360, partial [Akkermansiaceae bacterium]|nr:hypothetical protein [Akkermansiaceae bacterium]